MLYCLFDSTFYLIPFPYNNKTFELPPTYPNALLSTYQYNLTFFHLHSNAIKYLQQINIQFLDIKTMFCVRLHNKHAMPHIQF